MFETTCAIADWEPASDIKNCIKTKKKLRVYLSVVCSRRLLRCLILLVWQIESENLRHLNFHLNYIMFSSNLICSRSFCDPENICSNFIEVFVCTCEGHLISWYLTWCGRICHKEVLKFCVPYFVRSHEKKLNLSPKFDQLNGGIFSFSQIYRATMAMS